MPQLVDVPDCKNRNAGASHRASKENDVWTVDIAIDEDEGESRGVAAVGGQSSLLGYYSRRGTAPSNQTRPIIAIEICYGASDPLRPIRLTPLVCLAPMLCQPTLTLGYGEKFIQFITNSSELGALRAIVNRSSERFLTAQLLTVQKRFLTVSACY